MTSAFERYSGTPDYIAPEDLRQAVNVALALRRPLLVRGEPGTGKTLLARSVSAALGLEIIEWPVKSTTRAQDGLYVYDAVQRLHDSRFQDKDVSDISKYIRLGPVGRAFDATEQKVLLIDEVDKADIEFPNDLLHELDQMRFTILETGRVVEARYRPVVIITSNAEKELPDAFLRRCVFHFIRFPDQAAMADIVHVHYPDLDEKLLSLALARFYALRGIDGLRKKPSTSELIDWILALRRSGVPVETLERDLPFLGALIKTEADVDAVNRPSRRPRG
ncbi:MAG: MoxR family ATPase [Myxococcales bacterium]|nr:MoxR family ATPase [Myxococcales bacterium]